MAKKEKSKEVTQGMEDMTDTPSRRDACYPVIEPGAFIRGVLVARHEGPDRFNRGQTKVQYQLTLTRPCMAVKGRGDDAETVEAQPGETAIIDRRGLLFPWESLPFDGTQEVAVRFTEKVKRDGGKQEWLGVVRNTPFVQRS